MYQFCINDDLNAQSILSEAFEGDPVMTWISTDPSFLSMLFEFLVPLYREQGMGFMTNDRTGVALWMKPGNKIKLQLSSIKYIFKLCKIIGLKSISKIDRLFLASSKYKPKEPHYYLYSIGVTKESKSKGVGSSLLKPILIKSDTESKSIYLENTKYENIPFYAKHGFKVIEEVNLGKNAPKMWLMVRQGLRIS